MRPRIHADGLLGLIGAYPGLHVRELARESGLSEALASYHVRRLVSEGLVEGRDDGHYLRLFTMRGRQPPDRDKQILALLRQRIPLAIVLFLVKHRQVAHGDLATGLGIPKSTITYHVSKLVDHDVLAQEPDSRILRLKDHTHVVTLLERWRPTSALVDSFATSWAGLYRSR